MTRPERLKTSLTSLGTKLFVSVCRSASVAPLTPTYHLWSPTGDKPWYLYQGKFAAVLHHAFHLGLSNEGRENYTRQLSGHHLTTQMYLSFTYINEAFHGSEEVPPEHYISFVGLHDGKVNLYTPFKKHDLDIF